MGATNTYGNAINKTMSLSIDQTGYNETIKTMNKMNKMAAILQTTFSTAFYGMKLVHFGSNFDEGCCWGSKWQ